MDNNLNEKLEQLNAQIDVCIDDEDYNRIWFDTKENDNAKGIITLDGKVESEVKQCFPDDNSCCTHNKDTEWQQVLSYDIDSLPVVKVGGEHLKPPDKYWSHLFYAKLLRAKIKQIGSDCYTRRLDDIAVYLERHLPQQSGDNEWVTRLTLIYLMELSAASMDWESLGYSERARRVIRDREYFLTQKYKRCEEDKEKEARKKAPYEFYELWAGFNIGVAYFHRAYYREAVQEFNKIIWQVERWKKGSQNMIFFEKNLGIALLYIPAQFSRSEVQLKLQMAYHTMDTLNTIEALEKPGLLSDQKKTRAQIIKAEAYQQLGRLDRSWDALERAYNNLGCGQLGQRTEYIIPRRDELDQHFPTLGERFIDLLIADQLGWLKREGEDVLKNKEDDLELRYIVENDCTRDGEPATAAAYKKAVDDAEPYLSKLADAFNTYFKMVEHHVYNRNGYFQQLAKYLGWLAKAADWKTKDCTKDSCNKTRETISKIAGNLFDKAKRYGLLHAEPGMGDNDDNSPQSECQFCPADGTKGIDLRKLGVEHYEWFTKDMLKFFDSKSIEDNYDKEKLKENKQKFVKRLIRLERIVRNDLRINDLELHYDYYESGELLKKAVDCKNIFRYMFGSWKECKGRDLCWGDTDSDKFTGLLACAPKNKDGSICNDNTSYDNDYEKVMKDWKYDFLRHLERPSIHEHDTKRNQYYFVGLQRWNSSSPAKGYSVGGGYLLYHLDKENKEVDMGIAIDPGFDFVRNLFHSGFSLDDIDIILLSHAHVDHIRDFESIITLMYELKKETKRERRVHVILSLSTYERLKHIIESPGLRYFIEPYIIDIDREIDEDYFEHLGTGDKAINFKFKRVELIGQNHQRERLRAVLPEEKEGKNHVVEIMPTRAYHNDHTDYSDSFGFLIKLPKDNSKGKEIIFGYTGDTKWIYPNMPDPFNGDKTGCRFKDIAKQYEDCDALVVHLGSLIKKNDGKLSFDHYKQCKLCKTENGYPCEDLIRKANHPYLVGMLRLLSRLSSNEHNNGHGKPLIMISEFGEELKGDIRTDFVQRLQETYKDKLCFLPMDVGTNIELCEKGIKPENERGNKCNCRVWCVQCQKYVNINDADFEMYGNDNALYCVCKTCKKATPDDVLQTKLRKLYEVGYEIKTRKDDDNKHS